MFNRNYILFKFPVLKPLCGNGMRYAGLGGLVVWSSCRLVVHKAGCRVLRSRQSLKLQSDSPSSFDKIHPPHSYGDCVIILLLSKAEYPVEKNYYYKSLANIVKIPHKANR